MMNSNISRNRGLKTSVLPLSQRFLKVSKNRIISVVVFPLLNNGKPTILAPEAFVPATAADSYMASWVVAGISVEKPVFSAIAPPQRLSNLDQLSVLCPPHFYNLLVLPVSHHA
ncbi:hypothetical protein F511_30916 [Dorcoceras hygrometricum]|uniref:Uncharacterized protein n=1 Tax=Dorcoceras hygrometricum TaxID=472368 RepID=A0A2Z7AL43_9LAMI|nr:hypothetical protein F511_30916 [Dorcoceras hygrometricum]